MGPATQVRPAGDGDDHDTADDDDLGNEGLVNLQFGMDSEKPQNGASIGIKGDLRGAGTLGGYVTLKIPGEDSTDPGKTYRCALTNYHVIEPKDPKVAAHILRSGIAISDDDSIKPFVTYPSHCDLQATIQNYTKILTQKQEKEKKRQQDKANGRDVKNRLFERLDILRAQYQAHLDICHRLDNNAILGRVLVASGISGCPTCTKFNHGPCFDKQCKICIVEDQDGRSSKGGKEDDDKDVKDTEDDSKDPPPAGQAPAALFCLDEHHKRDWALIEVIKDKFNVNKAPPSSLVRLKSEDVWIHDDNAIIEDIAEPEPDAWVVFMGRTSNVSCGKVGKTRFDGRWTHSYMQGDERVTFVTWTGEWQIMPLAGEKKYETWSGVQPGDSGAWVLNEYKELVGLIHGRITGTSVNIGLFTPIEEVFLDIEYRTRGTVQVT